MGYTIQIFCYIPIAIENWCNRKIGITNRMKSNVYILPGVNLVCGVSANADEVASLALCGVFVDWAFGFCVEPLVVGNGTHRRRFVGR